jgi:hypothetical protein
VRISAETQKEKKNRKYGKQDKRNAVHNLPNRDGITEIKGSE